MTSNFRLHPTAAAAEPSVRPPHPLAKFVVFLVKDKGAPILVPEKHEEDQQ
jgi:hypothetical protein